MQPEFVEDTSCQWSSRYRFVVSMGSVLNTAGALGIPIVLIFSLCLFVVKSPKSRLIQELQMNEIELSEINNNHTNL